MEHEAGSNMHLDSVVIIGTGLVVSIEGENDFKNQQISEETEEKKSGYYKKTSVKINLELLKYTKAKIMT